MCLFHNPQRISYVQIQNEMRETIPLLKSPYSDVSWECTINHQPSLCRLSVIESTVIDLENSLLQHSQSVELFLPSQVTLQYLHSLQRLRSHFLRLKHFKLHRLLRLKEENDFTILQLRSAVALPGVDESFLQSYRILFLFRSKTNTCQRG